MKILGIVLVVLAIAIAVVPSFTNCDSQGKAITTSTGTTVPMKCLWTARASIALAIPTLAVGAMMVTSRRRESKMYLSIAGLVLGIFVVAVPTSLIGVCANPMMLCHSVEAPSLQAFGSIAAIGSIAGIVLAQRSKDKEL